MVWQAKYGGRFAADRIDQQPGARGLPHKVDAAPGLGIKRADDLVVGPQRYLGANSLTALRPPAHAAAVATSFFAEAAQIWSIAAPSEALNSASVIPWRRSSSSARLKLAITPWFRASSSHACGRA